MPMAEINLGFGQQPVKDLFKNRPNFSKLREHGNYTAFQK
jgi:hypothetical protein